VLIINSRLRVKLDRDQAPSSLPPVSIWLSLYGVCVCVGGGGIIYWALQGGHKICATEHVGVLVSDSSEIEMGVEGK